MGAIREYLIGMTAAALLCALVSKFKPGGSVGTVLRLLCGVVMALSAVAPWMDVRLDALTDFTADIHANAQDAAARGEMAAGEAMKTIITQQTEAYILDKAGSMGLDLTVEVGLSDDSPPVPVSVTIRGAVAPYQKQVLQDDIRENLGIPKEAQTWLS